MTKADLVLNVQESANIPTRAMAERAVNAVFASLSESLIQGESTAIVGFGTFSVQEKAARKGRNPQTGEPIDIPASKAVKFKVGKTLKDAVNAD